MREKLKQKVAASIKFLDNMSPSEELDFDKAMDLLSLLSRQDAYIDLLEKERAKWEELATEWHYKFFKATDNTEVFEQAEPQPKG